MNHRYLFGYKTQKHTKQHIKITNEVLKKVNLSENLPPQIS